MVKASASVEHVNYQADLVIIGGGGSGLAAAVEGAEAGLKNIMVLESRPAPGGNTTFAGGMLAAETPLQQQLGFDVSRDAVFNDLMNYAHWKPDAMLVRSLVDLSTDNIRWLEEKGVTFNTLIPHYPNQKLMTYHACQGPKRTGALIVKGLLDSCKRLGVNVLCDTAAQNILTAAVGGVKGVSAVNKEKHIHIDAPRVIIATGGFAGNSQMMRRWLPFYHDEMQLRGLPHRGDGILLAADAGAATGGGITLEAEGPAFSGSKHLEVMVKRPTTIWVNKLGERFTNEAALSVNEAANAIYNQPGKVGYTLIDEAIKTQNIQQDLSPFENMLLDQEVWRSGADSAFEEQINAGNVIRAMSWSDIAAWIGADPALLRNTIDTYNSHCRIGHDKYFLKDSRCLLPLTKPPFYAIPGNIQLLVTHGGIRTNHRLAVLNEAEQPIHGLYAAGDDTHGRMGDTYHIRLSGLSLCFAIGSGRLAGRNAAADAKSKG